LFIDRTYAATAKPRAFKGWFIQNKSIEHISMKRVNYKAFGLVREEIIEREILSKHIQCSSDYNLPYLTVKYTFANTSCCMVNYTPVFLK
jgi:hypothetical protein